jgi:rRNA maturation endonuclease Nob1
MSDKTKEQDIEDSWICLDCLHRFPYNVDGCPECGSQIIIETNYI